MTSRFLPIRRFAVLLALLFAVQAMASQDEVSLNKLFDRAALRIATPDARLHPFQIWVAGNDMQRARGLMFVKDLPADAGMLFIYSHPQELSMWMKNTFISLDMLFVAPDGKVVSIVANTTPESLKVIKGPGEVLAVIELNAGTCARLNIHPGAIVMHPAFGSG